MDGPPAETLPARRSDAFKKEFLILASSPLLDSCQLPV